MNAPMNTLDLERLNADLGKDPGKILDWALGLGRRAVVSTSFGPFAAVTLHMAVQKKPDIPVIWADTGYGTAQTYRFAEAVIKQLNLQFHNYRPRRSKAHREAVDGPTPGLGDPRLVEFTREVKLEPFDRALKELAAEVWITGIRAEETEERSVMSPISLRSDGILKVAPVLSWTAKQMNDYLKLHGLPNNFDYYDPTKVDDKRECGLHTNP